MRLRYRFSLLLLFVVVATGSLRAQRWHWAERVGKGPGTALPGGIGIDKAGNSYVVGTFESFIAFNTTTFNAATNVRLFLAKYDENGNLKWAAHGDGAGSFIDPSIAVDTAGNALAVWQQSDGTRDNIWANRYTPGGGWGTAELIETNNAGDAVNPQIAIDTAGNATQTACAPS